MIKIEVDEEVFKFLQENANAFVDMPNDVLRRKLLGKKSKMQIIKKTKVSANDGYNPQQFVKQILNSRFSGNFTSIPRYQFMFESINDIVYFQNFNKSNNNLWYRLNHNPIKMLIQKGKTAYICFTCPPEKIAYLIPLGDIQKQITRAKWSRESIEVNIDYLHSRWREFDWDIQSYLIDIS